jgi:O-antigen/teichoic acid export membrane protein
MYKKRDYDRLFFDSEAIRANLKEKSVRGGLLTMSAEGLLLFLRIGAIAVLARILIPEYFGLISMVVAITTIAERFKDLGLSIATIQYKVINHDQVSKLFWINALFGLSITVLISAASFLIARFYDEPRLIMITIAIASSFLWSGLTIQHQALLRRQMQFAKIAIIKIGATALSLALAIWMALDGYGYWALVWREVSRNVLIAIGTWAVCPWLPSLPKRNVKVGHMLRIGRDITGFNLLIFGSANLDQILIGKFLGAVTLGIYRQAYQLVLSPIMQLVFPVNYVAEPTLSRLQDNPERYRVYYQKLLTTLSLVTMPLVLFLVVYAEEIVRVLLGEKWMAATEIFRLLAIAAFIQPPVDTTGFVLVTCGKTKRYFNMGLAISTILVICVSIGLLWGARGVAFGHIVATYSFFLPKLYLSFRGTPVSVKDFFKAVQKPFFASLVMMAALIAWRTVVAPQSSFVALAIALPLAVSVYFTAWIMLPQGKAGLKQIIHDLMTPIRAHRFGGPAQSSMADEKR